jgi:hypothetical protein
MKLKSLFLFSTILLSQITFAQLPIKQWDVDLGSSKHDEMRVMKHTADGGYILGGFSDSPAYGDKSQASQGLEDFWIIRTDSNGNKQWDKDFGGSDKDDLISLEVTADGGFILGGYSRSGISGDKSQASQGEYDYWMVKTNSNGNKQWDARFGGSANDFLTVIHQTTDGGYILGGYTVSDVDGDVTQAKVGQEDYWIVKTDAGGVKQWDKRFGGTNEDNLQSLVQTVDGGYLLAGASYSGANGDKTQTSKGSADFWVVKTDSNGVKQWDKSYGGDTIDYCNAVIATTDNGFLLGGYSFSEIGGDKSQRSRGDQDYWVVKIDASGTLQWEKTFGGIFGGYEILTTLLQCFDGGFLLTGYSASPSSGDKSQTSQSSPIPGEDYWFVKIDSSGNYLWDARLGGDGYDLCYAALENADHGFSLGGYSQSLASGDKSQDTKDISGTGDYWMIKTTPAGIIPNIYAGTIAPDSLMQGDALTVPYTVNGTFIPGNIFYAVLSMNSGSFDNTDTIGSLSSIASGTINASIPTDILNGQNYHVRVISSDTVALCPANEEPITVGLYPTKLSDVVYGGDGADIFHKMIKTSEGGYVFGGETFSDASGDVSQTAKGGSDYWIIKTDSGGAKQWDVRFGTSSYDNFSTVVQTSDGGYLLGGQSQGGNNGDKSQDTRGGYDCWVVKTDENGVKQWDKRFGGIDNDYLTSLLQTSDGGYLLGGISRSPAGFDKSQDDKGIWDDYWIVKTNANGAKEWDVTLGGDDDDDLQDMLATPDGGYLLAGSSRSPISDDVTDSSRGSDDFWLVKIDADGVKQWDKKYGGINSEFLKKIKPTFEGGYILSGLSGSPPSGEVSEPIFSDGYTFYSDYWIIKLDSNANKEWDMRFGGTYVELGGSVIQTSDSGYLIGGSSLSRLSGNKTQDVWRNYDYWAVRINSQHVIVWDSRYGGNGGNDNDMLEDILQTSDGNFLLGGFSDSFIGHDKSVNNHNGGTDFWIIKINDAGYQADSGIALPVLPLQTPVNSAIEIFPNPFSASTTILFSLKKKFLSRNSFPC